MIPAVPGFWEPSCVRCLPGLSGSLGSLYAGCCSQGASLSQLPLQNLRGEAAMPNHRRGSGCAWQVLKCSSRVHDAQVDELGCVLTRQLVEGPGLHPGDTSRSQFKCWLPVSASLPGLLQLLGAPRAATPGSCWQQPCEGCSVFAEPGTGSPALPQCLPVPECCLHEHKGAAVDSTRAWGGELARVDGWEPVCMVP